MGIDYVVLCCQKIKIKRTKMFKCSRNWLSIYAFKGAAGQNDATATVRQRDATRWKEEKYMNGKSKVITVNGRKRRTRRRNKWSRTNPTEMERGNILSAPRLKGWYSSFMKVWKKERSSKEWRNGFEGAALKVKQCSVWLAGWNTKITLMGRILSCTSCM